MISSNNPCHRMREIDERLAQILMALAPAYAAITLLGTDDNGVDVTLIESHPVFAPLWKEGEVLKSEKMMLGLDAAIEWEAAHPATRTGKPAW